MAELTGITRTATGQFRLDFDAAVTFSDATGMTFTIDDTPQTIFAAVGSGTAEPFLIVAGDPGDGTSFDYAFAYDGTGDLSPVTPPLSASNSYVPPAPFWPINNRSRANTYPYHQISTTDGGNLFFSVSSGDPDLSITAVGLPPGISAVQRTGVGFPVTDLVGTFTQIGVYDIELQYTDELGRVAFDSSTSGNFGEDHFKFTLEVGTQAGPDTPPTGVDYIFSAELNNGSTPTAFASSNPDWTEFDARDRSCFVLGNNSGDGGKRVGCLVTQQHVITAAHYPCAGVGDTIRALAEDGTVETRTVSSIATVSDSNGLTDIRVLTLSSALPAKFQPAPLQINQPTSEAYAVNQDGAIGTRRINAWGGLLSWPTGVDGGNNTQVVRHQEPSIVAVEPTPFVVRTFDSGCPVVVPAEDSYALVGPHLTSTANSYAGAYATELAAIVSPLSLSFVVAGSSIESASQTVGAGTGTGIG